MMLLLTLWCCTSYAQGVDVWDQATLYRDEWGTPHVYADNPFSMAYVFGYAQAEDHGEHLLLAYRMANGQLAAVLGEAWADSDAFSLKMGHARLAEQALAVADPVTVALCEGFAMGINAWLVDHAASLPSWADGVQPQDVLAYWHAFLMSMAPFELPDVYHRAPAMASANAWAVSAERSTEGNPVLVINPHQNHTSYFQWYEAHLVVGDMDIYGTTLRGLPVILQGHNGVLGWGMTPNWPDFADMFVEEYESPQRNPKDPRKSSGSMDRETRMLLRYMSQSLPYTVRTNTGMETRYVPAVISDRGPIFENAGQGLNSWYIGGFTDFGGLRQVFEMARAPNLAAFWAALSMHQLPCFNIVYADREGNIFYLYNTKAGLRASPSAGNQQNPSDPTLTQDWRVPVPSDLSSMAWRGVIPIHNLPRVLNPPSGYIQACGNPPWLVTDPSPFDPSLWPAWLFHDQNSYRSMRVRQLLNQGPRSFRDHQSMLFDVLVPAAVDMVPAILHAASSRKDRVSNAHPDFWKGLEVLRNWNYIAEVNSTGMTFYHFWWNFARNRAARHFPSDAAFYEAAINNVPGAQDILLRAVEEAANALRNEYGDVKIKWGDVHRIRYNNREAPLPGGHSGEPVFVSSDYVTEQSKLYANYGYGFAMVTQFEDVPVSVSLLPFGVSMRSGTSHYADQYEMLLERRFKRVRYIADDVLRNADQAIGKRLTLMPLGVSGMITLSSPTVICARLHTAIEAPEPLPRDAIPFSLFIRPEKSPAAAQVQARLSVYIPEALCSDQYFHELLLYRYEPGLSWQPIDLQHQDASSKMLVAEDTVLARWYVVLGPADAMPQEELPDHEAIMKTYEENNAQPGLDVLLAQPDINSDESKQRIFKFERLDDGTGEPRTEGEAAETQQHPAPPLSQIPGMHYGPGARDETSGSNEGENRKFHIERLDKEVLPKAQDAEPEVDEKAVQEPVQPSEDKAVRAVQEPETIEPANTETLEATIERQEERPPLPDIIPQDPGFVFGPSHSDKSRHKPQNTTGRVFRIEKIEEKSPKE